MRHTAASWLVMDGVPLYDVQALLGHESFATTQAVRASGAGRAQPGHRVVVAAAWRTSGV
jgi:integrase